jgi:hypothetical protein
MGAYDLNHSFGASPEEMSNHENIDMSAAPNTQMEDHESSGATTSVNTSATEDELESPSAPPAFDSFAWLAIGLSIVVGAGSAYYFRKSKKQLEGTLETLERNMNS